MKFFNKYIAVLIAVFAFNTGTFAADYNINWPWNNNNAAFDVYADANYVQALTDASLTFSISNLDSKLLNNKIGFCIVSANGDIILDPTNIENQMTLQDLMNNDVSLNMNTNDKLSVWYRDSESDIWFSNITGNEYGTITVQGYNDGPYNEWFPAFQIDIKAGASVAPKPSGQPLPGILATMAIAGAVMVPLRKKFKKTA